MRLEARGRDPSTAARTLLTATLALATFVQAPGADGPQLLSSDLLQYLDIVARYRRGTVETAVLDVILLPPAKLSRAIADLHAQPIRINATAGPGVVTLATVEAAILLHSDAALAIQKATVKDVDYERIHRNLEIALNLVTHVDDVIGGDASLRGEVRRVPTREWLLVAIGIAQGTGELQGTGDLCRRALARFPDDPQVLMAFGMYEQRLYDERAQDIASRRERVAWAERPLTRAILGDAAQHFRRALERDPLLHEARVRLAHAEIVLGRADRAASLLAEARTASRDAGVLYLAQLFTARLAEKGGAVDEAIDAYGAAVSAVPGAQAARIGLAQALERSGRIAEARAAMAPALAEPPGRSMTEDPWWAYPFGYAPHALRSLEQMRERVMLK
jgi:tetratricopeptide (TPR) repeat protein